MIGIDEVLLIDRPGLDRTSADAVADDVVRHVVIQPFAARDVEDILFFQGVELQHMLSHAFHALLKGGQLSFVAQYTYDVVAGHDAQLRIERLQHLQMGVAYPVENDGVDVF